MRVLALASYPIEAAATRYRLQQFVKPLAARGISLDIRSFLDSEQFRSLYQRNAAVKVGVGLLTSALKRAGEIFSARHADVILIQREAMLLGPPVIEWIFARAFRRPMVLDLDDATYVAYSSPTYGSFSKFLKWFSKTDDLIRWASVVTCGNRSIAEYVTGKGARACIVPTVVDPDIFKPRPRATVSTEPVLGWIGTHSTFPYLESIFPALTSLAEACEFRLRIVGAGRSKIDVPKVKVENVEWSLDREVRDFQEIDIGLYPIDASLYSGKWAQGKSGFKAVQYMAVGVPYVATPVGGSVDIGTAGVTHLFASTNDEWYGSLRLLLNDQRRRQEMGAAGRAHALEHYGLEEQADKFAQALNEAAMVRAN